VAFNLDSKFPVACRVFPESHVRGRRKKRMRSQSVASQQEAGNDDDDAVVAVVPDGAKENGGEERAHENNDTAPCTMCLRYNSMLHLDFVTSNDGDGNGNEDGNVEMVIVEQPWLSVVASLPEALHRRVYGS